MGTIYFLIFVAVCAVVFAGFILRSSRGRRHSGSGRQGAQRHTQPLYRHQQAGHSLLHSHAGHLPSESHDVWRTRRQHANEEHWEHPSSSMTAHHVRSDAEQPEREPEREADDEMTMSTIEYTPQSVSRTGSERG